MTRLNVELDETWIALSRAHEVLPFLERLLAVPELGLHRLPAEMQAIVTASPDFRPILAGEPPTWMRLTSSEGEATLVLYRARADDALYVAAPLKEAAGGAQVRPLDDS